MRKKFYRGISIMLALSVFMTQNQFTAFAGDSGKKSRRSLSDDEDEVVWAEDYRGEENVEGYSEEDSGSFDQDDLEADANNLTADDEAIDEAIDEAYVISEIVENRDEYSKEYLLSDDSRAVFYYAEPVHYEAEDGSWEEIDNTLVATDEGYENADNSFHVHFTDNEESQGEVIFEDADYTVNFEFMDEETEPSADTGAFDIPEDEENNISEVDNELNEGKEDAKTEGGSGSEYESEDDAESESTDDKLSVSLTIDDGTEDVVNTEVQNPELFGNRENNETDKSDSMVLSKPGESQAQPYIVPESTITYEGYNKDVALQYSPTPDGIKENIVLGSLDAGSNFTFRIKLSGLKARLTSANEVELYDEDTDEIKYYFPAPFMEDTLGRYSEDVWYSLSEKMPLQA
jgi:hypothetical protein